MMNLQLDKAAAEKGRSLDNGDNMDEQVHKLLQQSVGSGRVGNLKVDPQYLVFEPESGELNMIIEYNILITIYHSNKKFINSSSLSKSFW